MSARTYRLNFENVNLVVLTSLREFIRSIYLHIDESKLPIYLF